MKYKIEIQCDEWWVADSLHELGTMIECGDLLDQMQDGSVEVSGDHFTAEIKRGGMTVQELRDIIADFTGDDKREAMRKAKLFAEHISLRHVSEISSMRFGMRNNGNGIMEEDRNWLELRWRDLDGDGDVFSIIE